MKIFMDTEFTGLHQNTTLISIGLVSEYGDKFYGELNDYDENQVDEWLRENVIDNLLQENSELQYNDIHIVKCTGDNNTVRNKMNDWFEQIMKTHNENVIEVWSDCLAYDWVLFNQMYGHACKIPHFIYYIPFDICTLFKLVGVDPDINREEFSNRNSNNKHNALHDAEVIRSCFDRLVNMMCIIKK